MFDRSIDFYDKIYGFKNYAAESERLRALIQSHSPHARTLLDVACGTGLHLSHLAGTYEASGLDVSEEFLAKARERNPGLSLHRGDMVDFDLGRQFDVITCLFSSIGYLSGVPALDATLANFVRHLAPGGLVVIEPWFTPETWKVGMPWQTHVDESDFKVTRMNVSARNGRVAILDFHFLVGTPDGVTHFTEHHEAYLFTDDEYESAITRAGLQVEKDDEGLVGRGLYLGTKPRTP